MIRRNPNSNRFCGPAALAFLAGVHVDDAAHALRIATGKRSIKGVLTREMQGAMGLLGLMAVPVPLGASATRPTLAQLLRGPLKARQASERFLVVLTGHYVSIQGRKLFDNINPTGVFLGKYNHRRKRVKSVWSIHRLPQSKGHNV